MRKHFLLLVILLTTFISLEAKDKIQKGLFKVEELVQKGELKKAEKINEKLLNKLKAATSNLNKLQYGWALIRKGQINAYQFGDRKRFTPFLKRGEDIIKSIGKENSSEYIESLLESGKAYFGANFYLDASLKMIEIEDGIAHLEKPLSKELSYEVNIFHLKTLHKLGEYKEGLKYSMQLLKASNVESDLERQYRFKVINIQILLYLSIGEYKKADELIDSVYEPIRSYSGKNSLLISDLSHLIGRARSIQNNLESSLRYWEDAYAIGDKKGYPIFYSEYTSTRSQITEEFVFMLDNMNQNKYASDVSKGYLKYIKKITGNNHHYRQIKMYSSLKNGVISGDYQGVVLEIDRLRNSDSDLFSGVYFSQQIEELALTCNYKLQNYLDVEKNLFRLKELDNVSFGDKSLHSYTLNLDIGRFYALDMLDFMKAKDIFIGESFNKVADQLAYSHQDMIYYNEVLAEIYVGLEEYYKAKEVLSPQVDYLELYFKDNINESLANLYVEYAKVLIETGDYRLASQYLEKSQLIFSQITYNVFDYEYMLKVTASYYTELRYYEEALFFMSLTEKLLKDYGENLTSRDLSDFALLYIKTGKFKGVEDLLLSVITQKKERYGSETINVVTEYNQLAELYMIQGRYTEAEEYLVVAEELFVNTSFQYSLKITETQFIKAQLYYLIGDYEQSAKLFHQIRLIQEKKLHKNHPKISYTIQEEAMSKLALNITEGVEDDLIKAVNILKVSVGEDSRAYAEALKTIAVYYTLEKKYSKAESQLKAAYFILKEYGKKVKNNESLSETAMLLGDVYKANKDFKNAESYYKKSKNGYKKIFGDTHPNFLHVVGDLAKVYAELGRENEAIELLKLTTEGYLLYINEYFPALTERQKTKFWAVMKSDFDYFNSLAINNYLSDPFLLDKIYNDVLTTKSLLLSSSIQLRKKVISSGDQQLIEKFDEWLIKKNELILLTGKSKEELVEIGINKEELINEVNQLEKYLSKNAEYLHFSSVKWLDIKAKLKNDEYAIEIVRSVEVVGDEKGKVNYIALIIDSDKKQKHPTLVKLEGGDSLEGDFFNFYRNAFNYKIHDNKSYSRYWEPIAKVIKEGAKVYLSPEGVYMLMNIEALEVSGSEVVMDRNEIVLLGNTRDILSSKSIKTKNVKSQALLIGSPEFYQKEPVSSVKPLDGAKEEVDLLSEKLKSKDWEVKTYVGGEAIEKRFLEGEGVRLIHVATHGYFENTKQMIFREEVDNSLFKSGLIMTGGGDLLSQGNGVHQKQGVLTSYEALNLKLDNVELVVLSACETGVGEVKNGEGVYGLQRSFLIAGASNVIMSLYKVPDVVTMELMLNFYDNWLESNDKHDAFMKAKQTVRAKYNSPYYWGAFVIIGMD